jgi:hypothetical protein
MQMKKGWNQARNTSKSSVRDLPINRPNNVYRNDKAVSMIALALMVNGPMVKKRVFKELLHNLKCCGIK